MKNIETKLADDETYCVTCDKLQSKGAKVAEFIFSHYEHGETFMQICRACVISMYDITAPDDVESS